MAFVPSKFADLGKQVKDLLSDDFKYDNKLVIKRTTASGLKLQSTTTAKNSGLKGAFKGTVKDKSLGELEVQGDTSNIFSAKLKLTKLAPGVKTTVKVTSGAKKEGDATFSSSVTADYSQDNFSSTLDLCLKEKAEGYSGAISGSAVVGFEGVSVGITGNAKVDNKFAVTPFLPNMAFEIAEDDFSFGLATETLDNDVGLRAKFFQKVNGDTQRGLLFSSPENLLTVASKYNLDSSTTLKTSVCTNGIVQAAVKHTLFNPKMQLNLSTQFKTTNGLDLTAQKYGLGVTLGDF